MIQRANCHLANVKAINEIEGLKNKRGCQKPWKSILLLTGRTFGEYAETDLR